MKKQFDFEEALKRIEEINEILEKGDLPLEKSLEIYQEGVSIASNCYLILENAQLKIEEVNKEVLKNFNPDKNEGD